MIEIPLAVYIHFTSRMISAGYYYPLLIFLLACNEFITTLRATAIIGFFASISEPRIGATYMTLLVTLYNLGFSVNSSIVMYAAEWLPKRYAYVIAVSTCVVFGIVWIGLFFRTLKRLQQIPAYKWHLFPEATTNDATTEDKQGETDQEKTLISKEENKQVT